MLANTWELISRNPSAKVDVPKQPKSRIQTLMPEQAQQLFNISERTGRKSLYMAAVVTGTREGELLGLRWEDIDLTNCVIAVTGAMNRKRVRDTTKTEAGIRKIKIPQELADEISRLPRISEYVWCTREGMPISHRNLHRQYKNLLRKAGLPNVSFHNLRHTNATLLLEAGTPMKVVQERLGHSSIKVTMDVYSHVTDGMQQKAADDLSSILGLRKPQNAQALEQANHRESSK